MFQVTTYRKFATAAQVRTVDAQGLVDLMEAYGVPARERGDAGSYTYGEDVMTWEAAPAAAPAPATQRRAFAIFSGATINLDGRVVRVEARRVAGTAGARLVELLLSDGTRQALAPSRMVEVISR